MRGPTVHLSKSRSRHTFDEGNRRARDLQPVEVERHGVQNPADDVREVSPSVVPRCERPQSCIERTEREEERLPTRQQRRTLRHFPAVKAKECALCLVSCDF